MPTAVSIRGVLRTDLPASLVVFLVAVPLCVGVAVASGVPAELGLITGIVGGLVTGLLPGSSLQVSGPAAGLTVLVFEAVDTYGLAALGVIVVSTGLLQLLLGLLRLGRWFRAISVAVVEGMLAGIGLIIIAGQLYTLAGTTAPTTGLGKITGLPSAAAAAAGQTSAIISLLVGAGTIAIIVLWSRIPGRARVVPGALVAVTVAAAMVGLLRLPVATLEVLGLLDVIQPPSPGQFTGLANLGLLVTIVAFTLIASAESLFSAAAVDRLHTGARTDYDKELVAQGAGNTVCGLLGALPMTAVIVRSAANVHAGARTKTSRVMHGAWLLLFAALLPAVLAFIPTTALAGVLIYAGFKLLPAATVAQLWRTHRGEALVLLTTATAIVTINMFEGVLIGLLLSVIKTAWETSRLHIAVDDRRTGAVRVTITGNATFLRLPKLLDALEALPITRAVELDLTNLRHLDHACHTALDTWAHRHQASGDESVQLIRTA